MIVLIASHGSALLLYCLLLSCNFISTIDHRFSIRFTSGLDGSHSIIFSPVNLLCIKNSRLSWDVWEGGLLCINTLFTLKRNWDLYHAKKFLSIKSYLLALFSLTPSSILNGSVMVWSTIPAHVTTLPFPCCLLIATCTSEMDKSILRTIHGSIKCPLRFVRENFICIFYMYFLAQFWCFEIFAIVKVGYLENFSKW